MPIFGFLGIKWYKSTPKYEIGLNEACSDSKEPICKMDIRCVTEVFLEMKLYEATKY